MTAPYIHLIFSHIAVVGLPLVLLIFIFAYLKKPREVFIAGCWVLLIVSLAAIPTYWSGEPTEEIVKHYPHFSKPIQETHEQWGQYALLATLISGFLGLVCLFYDSFRKSLYKPLVSVTVLWLILNIVILLVTANYGGKIIHQEIRGQVTTPAEH
jgi:uncharacterized membrane protein